MDDVGSPCVGRLLLRRETHRLAIGQGQFTGDLVLPRMFAMLVRSPMAHARIHSVDLSQATAAAGVVCALLRMLPPDGANRCRSA